MNKYYELFINEQIDDSILDIKMGNASFEDHFWHLACLSVYYKKKNDTYSEKKVLKTMCDLNYAYSAMIYFKSETVLPIRYNQYLTKFEHPMKDDKLEERILSYNKSDKKGNFKRFAIYAGSSLLCIPLMLFLVFVCKLDTNVAVIISIVFIFGADFVLRPYLEKKSFEKKLNAHPLDQNLVNYLKYYDRFALLFKDDLYIDLIRVKKDDKKQEIVNKIKANYKDLN